MNELKRKSKSSSSGGSDDPNKSDMKSQVSSYKMNEDFDDIRGKNQTTTNVNNTEELIDVGP